MVLLLKGTDVSSCHIRSKFAMNHALTTDYAILMLWFGAVRGVFAFRPLTTCDMNTCLESPLCHTEEHNWVYWKLYAICQILCTISIPVSFCVG
jgi:hypothetical protein